MAGRGDARRAGSSAARSRSTAGRSPSARYLRVTVPREPVGVADVVEPAELAVELPEPGVVAHPVGAEVDEPGLAHAAVVERGRVARRRGRTRGPSAPAASRRGRPGRRGGRTAGCAGGSPTPRRERLDAVEAHAHADVPADHVGDVHRALHHRADRVALVDVLPEPRLGAATAPRAAYCGVDARRSARRCTARARWRRTSSSPAPSRARCGSCRRYWPDSSVPSSSRNTCAVHSWTARPANSLRLVEHADQRVAPAHPVVGPQRRPPLARARRVERVHAAQRVALHQVALVVGRPR